jgi:C_GCAxxG_C_C family probable redox protein
MSDVRKYFYNGGLNCAETTMKCLIEDRAVDLPGSVVRMMTGFGGGMQCGAVCGAVVASVAAIGHVTGRTEVGESRDESAQLVEGFLGEFETEFGSFYCGELQQDYVKEEMKSDAMYCKCAVIVERAVELTKELLSVSKDTSP